MDRKEHLLTCVAEEGGEVAQVALSLSQAAHKALRFGPDDGYPGTERTNRSDLVREVNDLIGVLEAMQEEGVELPGLYDRATIEQKRPRCGSGWITLSISAPLLTSAHPETNKRLIFKLNSENR